MAKSSTVNVNTCKACGHDIVDPRSTRGIRQAAGVSLDKVAALANVSWPTARLYEIDPAEVRDPGKRAALRRVYESLRKTP